MRSDTTAALTALNRRFYEVAGSAFDASRQTPWRGWQRVLADHEPRRVLDVGCGNARFAGAVPNATYVGFDTSPALVEFAARPDVAVGDLFDAPWGDQRFDLVVAFGLLHHVPDERRRLDAVRRLAGALTDDGRLVITVWQFEDVLADRFVPWSSAPEIDVDDLDPGDHLLSFAKQAAPRYCHAATAAEVERWRTKNGLESVDDFFSDGRNDRMNRYLVWSLQR